MSISHFIVGRKPTGDYLAVAIYAQSTEQAEREYEFRYRGLGYLLPKDFADTPEGESIPIVKFRSRQRHGLRQSSQETNQTCCPDGMGSHEGSLDYIQPSAQQDDQNVVYVGE
jgi:hypothetical protein